MSLKSNKIEGCDNPIINLLVLDLECTCEQNINLSPSEIIEIGAVVGILNQDAFEITNELQLFVRPVIHPTLTDFCTQLTGITQTTVNEAAVLSNALSVLQDCIHTNHVIAWASWGKGDWSQFTRECELKSLSNPMATIQHFNLKQLFARRFKHRVGLNRALQLQGMSFLGNHHSGIADAKNISRLLSNEQILREGILKKISSI